MYGYREVHADVTVILFKLLLKIGDLSDVRLGRLRPLYTVQLILHSHCVVVIPCLFLHSLQLILDEGLALVVVQGSHAAQIEKGQLCEGLGVSDQLPLLEKHAWLV